MLQTVFSQCMGKAFGRRLPAAVANQAGDFAGAPGQQRFDDVHTDKAVGAGDDHLVYIAHAADRQRLDIQFAEGIGQGFFAQYFFGAGATNQGRQLRDGRQFDEAVDRDAAAELLTQTQEHARQQDRVAAQIEEAFVGGNIAGRQLQQLGPDLQQQRFIGTGGQAP